MTTIKKPQSISGRNFEATRIGFMTALSFRESSSDLLLPHTHTINRESHRGLNPSNYVGYFQFGEDALKGIGYYKGDSTPKTDPMDWIGGWTGKDGINSLLDFRNSPEVQIKAFNSWLEDRLCYWMRNYNINEFFGMKMNGIELTESGCIAATHLTGIGSMIKYVESLGSVNKKDGNGIHLSHYMDLFNYYDLETCCNRKIYIKVEKNRKPVSSIEVKVESEYKDGKYYSKIGKITNTYTTDKDGKIPVIVRHPGAQIKITVNGKSQTIIQEANKRQSYTIDITGSIKATGALNKPSTPKPRPVPNKSPQDVRNEQNKQQSKQPLSSETIKDITFNITIVEGDTKKPITNMRYYLIYKGNPKEHRTDNQGIESNITAEVGQDIEVSVAGEGRLQAVAHFKVDNSHQGKTIRALLPVQALNIEIKDHNKLPVKNTKFMIFYRGREIVKQTNSQGLIGVKMLVGFVYKFGLANGKPLVSLRCLKGVTHRTININETAKSKATGVSNTKPSPSTDNNTKSSPKPASNLPSTKPTVAKPKTITEQSHTESNGRPVTSVMTDTAASDTTRYHIYHNGDIKRQNGNATGYAEFIYYDEKGGKHNLGKSKYIVGDKFLNYRDKNDKLQFKEIDGDTYLIDQKKHNSYRKGKTGGIGYYWWINSNENREYIQGLPLACILGAMCKIGYGEYTGSGFSIKSGSSGVKSKTHINGINGDFRYLAVNNRHMKEATHTTHNHFDWDANVTFVNTLYDFGYKSFLSQPVKVKNRKMLPHSSPVFDHHHHVHLQGFKPKVTDI